MRFPPPSIGFSHQKKLKQFYFRLCSTKEMRDVTLKLKFARKNVNVLSRDAYGETELLLSFPDLVTQLPRGAGHSVLCHLDKWHSLSCFYV